MSRLGRVVCWFRGHADYSTTILPEEAFGLYAYSRIWCPRCGKTIVSRSIEDQIDVLMGYVELANDVRPVVEAARKLVRAQYATNVGSIKSPPPLPHEFTHWVRGEDVSALVAALAKYEDQYPAHFTEPAP